MPFFTGSHLRILPLLACLSGTAQDPGCFVDTDILDYSYDDTDTRIETPSRCGKISPWKQAACL